MPAKDQDLNVQPILCLQMPNDSSGHWAFSAFHSMMTTVDLQHRRFNDTCFKSCQIMLLVFYKKSNFFVSCHFISSPFSQLLSHSHVLPIPPFLHNPCYQRSPSMTTSWGTNMAEENEQSCQHSIHGHKVIKY